MTRVLQILGLLIAVLGCVPYRIQPSYIRTTAQPSLVSTQSVGLEIHDQRSAEKLLLGRTRDMYNRRIESEVDPTVLVRTAILISLSNAGFSTDDSADRKLVVNLRDFSVTWSTDVSAPARASVAMEVRVEENRELVGSRTYSAAKQVRRKSFLSNGSQEGQRALSAALTEAVDRLGADAQLKNWISEGQIDPEALESPREASTGIAFAVSGYGKLLTGSQVVESCKAIVVISGGEPRSATVLREDRGNGLALLDVQDFEVDPLPFRGTPVRWGESVVVLGFPPSGYLAHEVLVSTGAVTSLSGLTDEIAFIQISAPLQPANSGGPVLDLSGRVVGVAVAKLDALRFATATSDIPEETNLAVKGLISQAFLQADHVDFEISNSEATKSAADVAEQAKGSVFRVRCEKE